MTPLACAICPTYNRREFIPRAIKCFFDQDYPNKRLLILDDGTDKIEDLVPVDPSIVYMYHPTKETYGAKLNRLCDNANSEYILHWDDDDWHSSSRITRQIRPLIQDPNLRVSGTSVIYYYIHGRRQGMEQAYIYKGDAKIWIGGIGYAKTTWAECKFDDNPRAGADTRWLAHIPVAQRHDVADPALFIASVHPTNDSHKNVQGTHWGEVPWKKFQYMLNEIGAKNF